MVIDGVVIERRWVSLVLAVMGALATGAAGCGDDEKPRAGLGQSGGHGGGRSVGRGGDGGSAVGGMSVGGSSVAGAGGTATGGATGAGGCQLPSGPAGSWVEITPPAGQSGFRVTDAFAVGPNDLLFAGNTFDGLVPPTNARVLRWRQGCWTVELAIPPSTGAPSSPSVHGIGPNDIWAEGGDVLYHRDAQGWLRFADESWRGMVRPPPPFSSPIELIRVRAAAANDVWVAAVGNILHFGGGQWTTYSFDDPDYPNASASVGFYYNDIWVDSPTSVWVGGPTDQVGNTMDIAAMHHFDGAGWTIHAVFAFSLEAIWRSGAAFWVTGVAPGSTTLNLFNGTAWMGVPIAGVDPTQSSPTMTSLFGHGASDIWAAGDDVAHYDGQVWSLAADAPAAARSSNFDPRNTYVTGDAGSVWLATTGPRFFRKATGP